MGGDPFDIFNSIFKEFNQGGGQGQGGFNFGNFQQQFRNQPKVNNYYQLTEINFYKQYDVNLTISMKEACLGTTKRVRMMLESECPDCNGTGAKKGSGSTVRK